MLVAFAFLLAAPLFLSDAPKYSKIRHSAGSQNRGPKSRQRAPNCPLGPLFLATLGFTMVLGPRLPKPCILQWVWTLNFPKTCIVHGFWTLDFQDHVFYNAFAPLTSKTMYFGPSTTKTRIFYNGFGSNLVENALCKVVSLWKRLFVMGFPHRKDSFLIETARCTWISLLKSSL